MIEKSLYYLVNDKNEGNGPSKWVNYFLMTLIMLTVGEMALETDKTIYEQYKIYFTHFDYFTLMVFTVEFVIRIITAHLDQEYKGETRWQSIKNYLTSFAGVIDMISIFPFYFNMAIDGRIFRMLKLARLFRVFKIARYNKSMKDIIDVISAKRSEIGVIMGLIIIIMIISAFMMFYAEQHDNPEMFPNVLSCLWWAIVTMTTIGYGDVYPVTFEGKIIGSVMALLGIGLVAMPTGIISAGFLEKVNERKKSEKSGDGAKDKDDEKSDDGAKDEKQECHGHEAGSDNENDKKHYCPYCGHKLD